MLKSVPRCRRTRSTVAVRRVSPRSFPHLWKKLWKSRGEGRQDPESGSETCLSTVRAIRRSGALMGERSRNVIMIGSNLWDQVLSRIEAKVNRHSFYTWFKPTTFVEEREGGVRSRPEHSLPGLAHQTLLGRHR